MCKIYFIIKFSINILKNATFNFKYVFCYLSVSLAFVNYVYCSFIPGVLCLGSSLHQLQQQLQHQVDYLEEEVKGFLVSVANPRQKMPVKMSLETQNLLVELLRVILHVCSYLCIYLINCFPCLQNIKPLLCVTL